jgi:hypothetical protein
VAAAATVTLEACAVPMFTQQQQQQRACANALFSKLHYVGLHSDMLCTFDPKPWLLCMFAGQLQYGTVSRQLPKI